MPRRRSSDLKINHERWLVSYADFITLLFAFFVVMYSISQVNESKYRVLSSTLQQAFKPAASVSPPAINGHTNLAGKGTPVQLSLARGGNLGILEESFRDEFSELLDNELMRISSNEMWLQIELRDNILFDSASADVSRQAREIFSRVSTILSTTDNPIQIEGFTDNVPIATERFPSNWELSSARASAIVKWMAEQGVDASRLAAVGYGEHQPIADNNTPDGRAQNRRVAIMIARDTLDRPSNSLDELAGDQAGVGGGIDPPSSAAAAPEAPQAGDSVEAVEMGNGDLLFSSDPDLPREAR